LTGLLTSHRIVVCGSPTDVDIIEFDTTRIDDRGVYRDIVRMTATVVAH